jgi:hypothetical protein
MSNVPKLIRDNKVAVLLVRGYGSGWFSWYGGEEKLFDPILVDLVLKNEDGSRILDIHDYCNKTYPDCMVSDFDVEWVDIRRPFMVKEYDGYESIVFQDEIKWIVG